MRKKWVKDSIPDDLLSEGLLEVEVFDDDPGDFDAPPIKASRAKRKPSVKHFESTKKRKVSSGAHQPGREAGSLKDAVWVESHWNELDALRDALPAWAKWESFEAIEQCGAEGTKVAAHVQMTGFQLLPSILRNLQKLGFEKPMPVQAAVIPVAIALRSDVVVASQTGSGKTIAFAVPLVQNLLQNWIGRAEKYGASDEGEAEWRHSLEALVVLPSRELAVQVHECVVNISADTPLSPMCIVGGIFWPKQQRILAKKRPKVIVATLGRLSAHIFGETEKGIMPSPHLKSLRTLRMFVLDEADRFVEPGRYKYLRAIMEKISDDADRRKLQTILLSATLAMPSARGTTKKFEFFVKGPLELIPLRKDHLFSVDLSHAEPTKGVLLPRELPDRKKKLERKAGESNKRTGVKCDVKLPDQLKFSIMHGDDLLNLDEPLVAFLWCALESNPEHFKAMVFVNSIDSADRLKNLLAIVFESELSTRRRRQPIFEADEAANREEARSSSMCVQEAVDAAKASEGANQLLALFAKQDSRTDSAEVKEVAPLDDGKPAVRRKKSRNQVDSFRLVEAAIVGLHGGMKMKKRLKNREIFCRARRAVLVCTDVAARGLDFENVQAVIHMRCPLTPQLFVHRSGRVARGLSTKDGHVVLMVASDDHDRYKATLQALELDLSSLPKDKVQLKLEDAINRGRVRKLLEVSRAAESWEYKMKKSRRAALWEKKVTFYGDLEDLDDKDVKDMETNRMRQCKAILSRMLQKKLVE